MHFPVFPWWHTSTHRNLTLISDLAVWDVPASFLTVFAASTFCLGLAPWKNAQQVESSPVVKKP